MLPCSVATVATGRSAVSRPGICTTLRRTCTRTSGRAFLANRLLLRKQQGEERRGFPHPQREVRRVYPPSVSPLSRISTMLETGRGDDTKRLFRGRISDVIIKMMTLYMRGFGVRPCPVRWQPWQRVEVRSLVLEFEQPCDEREHEHRGEPILSNDGAYNQKHTAFLHRRQLRHC